MAKWINHVTIDGPRNATSTHTVNPASGTVLTGTLFTPTAGNLLVCVADGAVTSTTPTGWTLPAGGSAINNCGLYVWYRTATGGDTFTTTHNGSNYPVGFDIYEFPAGSTFTGCVSATGVAYNGGAGPTLSGLTGTNLLCAASSQGLPGTTPVSTATWSDGTEAVDAGAAGAATDGYSYSLTYLEDSTLTSWSAAATLTLNSVTVERFVFAVAVAAAAAAGKSPVIRRNPARGLVLR